MNLYFFQVNFFFFSFFLMKNAKAKNWEMFEVERNSVWF